MVRHICLSVLLGAAFAAPAAAQQPNSSPSDNIVVTGQQYSNKVVCRFEANTGSRLQTRICHTNKEWDEIREQNMRDAREMMDRPKISVCRDSPSC